jgi:GNAT superfamily N-acetyltransferase
MAFVALREPDGDLIGVARMHADADYRTAEMAVLVRSDLKGRGLGSALMTLMIEYMREEGLEEVHGQVLMDNQQMESRSTPSVSWVRSLLPIEKPSKRSANSAARMMLDGISAIT